MRQHEDYTSCKLTKISFMFLAFLTFFFIIQIFMAAIAVVHMEAQWPLLQPTVPYVYGTYPAYPQVRVIPRTNPVSPLTYGLCDDTLIELSKWTVE